jgi:hypothetical protein
LRISVVVCLFFCEVVAGAYAPTLLLGLYGQQLLTEEQGAQTGVRGSALFSWRTLMADNASLALYARSTGELSPLRGGRFYDSHTLSAESLIRTEGGRLFLEGGILGSVNGTIEGQDPYLRPDWRVGLVRTGSAVQTGISYSGYYSYQPSRADDSLFQGLTLDFSFDPSIRIRYGLEVLGGWEIWTEENRNDFLGSLGISSGGLIGYFQDWSVAAQGGVRWSDQGEESHLFLAADAGWAWSPTRKISLEASAFAREELYLWSTSSPNGYDVFSMGMDVRGDWTRNDRFYLVSELSAARRFAEAPLDSRWSVRFRAGIEFSF